MQPQSPQPRAPAEPQPTVTPLPVPEYTELVTIRQTAGEPGDYDVTIVFRHPIQASGMDGRIPLAEERDGDSGLRIPGPITATLRLEGLPDLVIYLATNSTGRLAKAASTVAASTAGEAVSLVQNHLGVYLSRLCFESDAPITIDQVQAVEVSTRHITQHVVVRGRTRTVNAMPEIRVESPFFRAAFSVYREGLNSTNPYYSLLCFYRVIEGCQQYLSLVAPLIKNRGMAPTSEPLIVEDLDGISQDFPSWIGKRCNAVSQALLKDFRVPVAHGLSVAETLHAADQVDQESKYWKAVPVARQIARKSITQTMTMRKKLGTGIVSELGET